MKLIELMPLHKIPLHENSTRNLWEGDQNVRRKEDEKKDEDEEQGEDEKERQRRSQMRERKED